MRTLLHTLLLVGILFGLATPSMARAAEPCPMEHAQSTAVAGIEDCCSEDSPSSHDRIPCKQMTPACLAMTACATLGALDSDAMTGLAPQALGTLQFWTLAASLHGRTILPEIHPPARLG